MKDEQIKPYIPSTVLFNRKQLSTMLDSYSTIYFKPICGSGGKKIVKITQSNESFKVKHRSTVRVFRSEDKLYAWLKRFAGNSSFLLQRGIHLAKTANNPFDIRVMVQKDNHNEWNTTAIFCKVGRPGRIATNFNQGGKIQFINETLSEADISEEDSQEIQEALSELGLLVAEVFDRQLKGCKELGLDVALDTDLNLWILEVNTRPQIFPLKDMNNKELYNKIISYAHNYGRTK